MKKYFLYWLFIPIFTIICGVLIGYLDFYIISPKLPFPDACTYHSPEAGTPPFWMKFLYMDNIMHHVGPEPNSNHLIIFIIVSIILGIIFSRLVINNFFKFENNN
ncbi:hypothetical protein [Cloacibacterium normanense]|uniref:hypothetical protein n=1 Tax=Cloacibacterium normanense TaxID=237258 RepID=UPI000853A3D1|nr:hypothetical protein [Cloacibacterium normanense]AZI70146.1 hypothetical protein EB819_09740 [Cloacibacterium normanense]SDO22626.1 hypothetical protein SAMN04489756_10327 [Cloacibacterium normanense]